MNPKNHPFVKSEESFVESLIDKVVTEIEDEYNRESNSADLFNSRRKSVEPTGRNVRLSALWVIGSIKTDTELVDNSDEIFSGNFSFDKGFLEGTQDGEIKWDRYGEWFPTDIPDRVASHLQDGEINHAHALLSGRDPQTGQNVGDYYLRTNKASLVLYLMGYDRMCVDTRIYKAIKPVMQATIENQVVSHPVTADPVIAESKGLTPNPYREDINKAKKTPVMTHTGDGDVKPTFWEHKLKWNPIEYDALTKHMWGAIAERADVPTGLIPQLLFNLEGETTYHETLMNKLA
jgi:hypothetical protein